MRKPEPPDSDAAEHALFADAMADVAPLESDRHVPGITVRRPVPLSEREREVLLELDRFTAGEGPFELPDSDEFLEGAVCGLDWRVVKQLRKGEFTIQADLDLHGTDAPTARSRVESFILDCHAHGLRCVRVVHGRGRNSPGGVPVLKANLPRWLSRGPARHIVLAYTSALPTDGGTGASYLLLRKARARRKRPGSL